MRFRAYHATTQYLTATHATALHRTVCTACAFSLFDVHPSIACSPTSCPTGSSTWVATCSFTRTWYFFITRRVICFAFCRALAPPPPPPHPPSCRRPPFTRACLSCASVGALSCSSKKYDLCRVVLYTRTLLNPFGAALLYISENSTLVPSNLSPQLRCSPPTRSASQSRFGDELLEIFGGLSPERDCGPKTVKA